MTMTIAERIAGRFCEWLYAPRCIICKKKPKKTLWYNYGMKAWRFSIYCEGCRIRASSTGRTRLLARARAFEQWKTDPRLEMKPILKTVSLEEQVRRMNRVQHLRGGGIRVTEAGTGCVLYQRKGPAL